MEGLLKEFVGRKIDVTCGSSAVYRGDVVEVKDGLVQLRDEDGRSIYIAVDKISVVLECNQSQSRPGFIV